MPALKKGSIFSSAPPDSESTTPVRLSTTRTPSASARHASPSQSALSCARKSSPGSAADSSSRSSPRWPYQPAPEPDTSTRGRSPEESWLSEPTRLRVESTRESRISRFASSDHRCAITSPSRCTTASRPRTAPSGGCSAFGSAQVSAGTSSAALARSASRDRAVTSSPRATSARTSAAPIIPVAPVTATRIRRRPRPLPASADRGPLHRGLIGVARLLRALRDLGHGARDLPRHVAIEDARDDVVLVELVVADHGGDPARGRQLHLLGDRRGARVERAAEDPWEGQHVVDLVRVVGAAG